MKKSTGVILVIIIVLLLGVIGVGSVFIVKGNNDSRKEIAELKNEVAGLNTSSEPTKNFENNANSNTTANTSQNEQNTSTENNTNTSTTNTSNTQGDYSKYFGKWNDGFGDVEIKNIGNGYISFID